MKKNKFCWDKMFKIPVRKETNCKKCIHYKVCRFTMDKFCINYIFGNSDNEPESCLGCVHRYTRFPAERIPCFKCKYFRRK